MTVLASAAVLLLQALTIIPVTHDSFSAGVALSSDGKKLAYFGTEQRQEPALWVRDIAAASSKRALAGPQAGRMITFAPDGKSLWFVRPDEKQAWVNNLY